MHKAAVLNVNKKGELTILSCFHQHAGGKWLAIETASFGSSSAVQVRDRAKNPKGNVNKIPPTTELLKSTSNEDMMSIISSNKNRVAQEVSGTTIVDWEVIQGIFLGPNSNIKSQDILRHYVNLAKSDKTLADSSWSNRICNMVLQVELAQQDGTKTTGLATKPVCPDGKTHLKTIKQATNEFDATINENDNPHLDMEDKSIESKDSTEREIDTRNWKEQEMASFITSTIPNANTKPTPYRSKECEEDNSPPIPRKRDPTQLLTALQDKQESRKEDCHIP